MDVSRDIKDRRLLQRQFYGFLMRGTLQVFRHPDAVFIVKRDVRPDQIGAHLSAFGLFAMAVAAGLVVGILSPADSFRRIDFESAGPLGESARRQRQRRTDYEGGVSRVELHESLRYLGAVTIAARNHPGSFFRPRFSCGLLVAVSCGIAPSIRPA